MRNGWYIDSAWFDCEARKAFFISPEFPIKYGDICFKYPPKTDSTKISSKTGSKRYICPFESSPFWIPLTILNEAYLDEGYFLKEFLKFFDETLWLKESIFLMQLL